ncbi:MAG: cobaltochelatase subunit CobN, partial [Oxalobacter sp.]|nr:cobaltochelatase subunit CobN [Oxalobacter sp.]
MKRLLAAVLLLTGTLVLAAPPPCVVIVHNEFVLGSKIRQLQQWADEEKIALKPVVIEKTPSAGKAGLADCRFVIIDTPRSPDAANVTAWLGNTLNESSVPWIQVGGDAPASGNLPEAVASRLIDYYAHGGQQNIRHLYRSLLRHWQEKPLSDVPAPVKTPAAGIYHPAAPEIFTEPARYLDWEKGRGKNDAPRIGIMIHQRLVASNTAWLDTLIDTCEKHHLAPVVFWFDSADPNAVSQFARPLSLHALVNFQHMQNGALRQKEFEQLNIPVLAAFTYRDGPADQWRQSTSGINTRTTATLLTVPETWGLSDPLVIAAVEQGDVVAIPEQVDALAAKLARLADLKKIPRERQHLALLFWNHPEGDKNIAASGLNVPKSIEKILIRLQAEGYRTTPQDEAAIIATAQQLLGGYYRPDTLDRLAAEKKAVYLPVKDYEKWLATLPPSVRTALVRRWGQPEKHRSVRQIAGKKQFVIPAAAAGNLLLLPQPPRAGQPGKSYHDTHSTPDHIYLAAYLYLQKSFKANAIIHLGTHGTQEWLPGKDRGLSVHDFAFLPLGDIPVFYPYIQDNVGEALQARRRGRAVTISHQTPVFAPSGLYDELRDLHELIHQYEQADEGNVRERLIAGIQDFAVKHHLHRDMGWEEKEMQKDVAGFLAALHDHLHQLAASAIPVGLHTFGESALPEDRLMTVMQQLGNDYYQALGVEKAEVYAADYRAIRQTLPYTTLKRYLIDGNSPDDIADPRLKAQIARALALDRNLAHIEELDALVNSLAGGFVRAGEGGDPVRNPEVKTGRNLYAFEAAKLPAKAAYESGRTALRQLIADYRASHRGAYPKKLAFSLWSSEAIRHMGVTESQVLDALGLKPEWDSAGKVTRLTVIPQKDMAHPRIDAVIQVTGVYRDQFDAFMKLLAEGIARLAELDEPDNPVRKNSLALQQSLGKKGMDRESAKKLSRIRIFANESGVYGTGITHLTRDSTHWENDSEIAEKFLSSLQYGYGTDHWGEKLPRVNLFREQLDNVDAAVMARSSNTHGILSTDHPFEFLGGLSLAIRNISGKAPQLYIADLRSATPKTTRAEQFLSQELRTRYQNPHWIKAMQKEGYAGTLEILDTVNNLWGWQVTAPDMVRQDQWQAVHDTFVNDSRQLGMNAWFEKNNPAAQSQLIERMFEAIRKGYWKADEQTRRELVQRWQELDSRA